MSRFQLVDPGQTTGETQELLNGIQKRLGTVPNLYRALASSPRALSGVLALNESLGRGVLRRRDQERIALATAEATRCDYCLAAHTQIGHAVGLSDEEILHARKGGAADPKANAIVKFARLLVDHQGDVTTGEIDGARAAGLTDAELVEIVAQVGFNLINNYLNKAGKIDIDFPEVDSIQSAAA